MCRCAAAEESCKNMLVLMYAAMMVSHFCSTHALQRTLLSSPSFSQLLAVFMNNEQHVSRAQITIMEYDARVCIALLVTVIRINACASHFFFTSSRLNHSMVCLESQTNTHCCLNQYRHKMPVRTGCGADSYTASSDRRVKFY